jgi:hypothetical protein
VDPCLYGTLTLAEGILDSRSKASIREVADYLGFPGIPEAISNCDSLKQSQKWLLGDTSDEI